MTLKTGLIASLALNLLIGAFAAILLFEREAAAGRIADATRDPGTQTTIVTRLEPGLVDEDKVLALARLEAAIKPVAIPDFWKPDADDSQARQVQILEEHRDRIRSELISRYGTGAVEEPAFVRLFKPLNSRFPYLGSKSQLAMLKLQQTRLPPAAGNAVIVRDGAQSVPDAVLRHQLDHQARVRAILTPAEWQEYQVRESRTAKQLRASGVASDEGEFRAIFAILAQAEESATAASFAEARERLRSMLGESKVSDLLGANMNQMMSIDPRRSPTL